MEVSKTEAAVTEIPTKRLEEKGHALGLSSPLSFNPADPAEIPRGVGLIEPIFPTDEDWVIVDDDNPVSQIALSNCQHKLRNESQGAPLLARTSSGGATGEPQPQSFFLRMMELVLAGLLTGYPNTTAQAHRRTTPVVVLEARGLGRDDPGRTEPCEVGSVFTFASQTLVTTVLSQVSQEVSGSERSRRIH